MKKLLLVAVAILCVTAISVQAKEKAAKKELTAEQKQLMTDMLAKYDTDKNGKLDSKEKAAMSAEDKAAWVKAFPSTHKKKDGDAAAPAEK